MPAIRLLARAAPAIQFLARLLLSAPAREAMTLRKNTMKPLATRRSENLETIVVTNEARPSVAAANGPAAACDDLSKGHEVAELAYELFMQRGGQHGHDLEDWLAAERRLAAREG